MKLIDQSQVKTIAVIGVGLIGAGWTAWFLSRGFSVRASDADPKREAFLRNFVKDAWPLLKNLGMVANADPSRLTFHADPAEAARGADFVQENVFERLDLKQDVLAAIDAVLPPDRIIASSTSSYPPSDLQAKCTHAERVVVGHPFNPPHLIPLVEVVGGKKTDPAAVDWSMTFYDAIGKKAIRLKKEIVGHYVNRVQEAVFREMVHCVAEGIVSVEDADIGIAYGPGLRWAFMGPAFTYHMAGGPGGLAYSFDHFGPDMEKNWADLGNPKLTPELMKTFVEGTKAETHGKSYAELAGWRDRCLVAIQNALGQATTGKKS
jgi:carnitine 3-dehydrogenase